MNPDTMCPAEYEQLFPEHAKAKRVWEKSQAIANFTDFLRSNKVELCHKHVHVDACYGPWTPAMDPIGAFLREVEGVKHRAVICGHQSRDAFWRRLRVFPGTGGHGIFRGWKKRSNPLIHGIIVAQICLALDFNEGGRLFR